MQNARLDEAQARIKIAGRNTNNLWYANDTTFMEEERTKEPLDESERGEWKSWLKTQHSENEVMASGPIISRQMEKKYKQWQIFFSWAPKSLWMVTADMKLKDTCSLEEDLWLT